MAERPRDGSSVPRGDEATEGSEKRKKGESDALFNPPGLKRRTVVGLAPAPHLGGLATSPGAAQADEEARRQERVLNRERPNTGPPPASVDPGDEPIKPMPTVFAGTGPPPPVAAAEPAFGTKTMLMMPRPPTSDIPLSLPRQAEALDPQLPSSSGWEAVQPGAESVSPGFRSAPTVLVEPVAAGRRQTPHAQPLDVVEEAAPTTERMGRQQPMVREIPPSQPPTGLVVRRWDSDRPPVTALLPPYDKRLVLFAEPESPAADAYRVLRDHLLAKNLPRVIAVSSPQPRDGKTTCAINLALSLSEQPSMRVLLVDANFFELELSRIFQMERLPLLNPPEADVWLSPYRLAQVMPNLHLVAILRSEMPRRRRLEPQRFEALIDRLCRANYDYIVMDAPALHGSPSVGQLLAIADATLLAVRAGGGTTARELRRAADQIPKDKALGVALIDG